MGSFLDDEFSSLPTEMYPVDVVNVDNQSDSFLSRREFLQFEGSKEKETSEGN